MKEAGFGVDTTAPRSLFGENTLKRLLNESVGKNYPNPLSSSNSF